MNPPPPVTSTTLSELAEVIGGHLTVRVGSAKVAAALQPHSFRRSWIRFPPMVIERLEPRIGSQRFVDAAKGAKALLRRLRWARRPPWPGFGEPFNGQDLRRQAFEFLVERFSPTAFVETGTFVASTTKYLSGLGLDTYTVEVNPGFQAVARRTLRGAENVTLICGDSVAGIEHLANEGRIERPLAYLDAHWEERVPLAEELDRLFSNWEEVLAVVDDFHVPGAPGYGYDIYAGVALSAEEIELPEETLLAYPAAAPIDETGSRRGTAFVAWGVEARSALEAAERAGHVRIQRARNAGVSGAHEEAVDLKQL
jgi:predicted O-methyltransferase YrrM